LSCVKMISFRDQLKGMIGDCVGMVGTVLNGDDLVLESVTCQHSSGKGDLLQKGNVVVGKFVYLCLSHLDFLRNPFGFKLPVEIAMLLQMVHLLF